MRIGTKILLLMLAITVGSSAAVAWIVTVTVTRYETDRANDQISVAIARYVRHLDDQYQQVNRVVRALLEAPAQRSLIQAAAADVKDAAAREQLKQEVLGRDVQTELATREGAPAFHVLVNLAGETFLASAPGQPALEKILASAKVHWPADAVLASTDRRTVHYVATPAGLFLAMGVPLRTLLDETPDVAYFVGFRIDDDWVNRQLLSDGLTAEGRGTPLAAWFMLDDHVVARAASDPADPRLAAFTDATPVDRAESGRPTTSAAARHVQFTTGPRAERSLGQSFDLRPANATSGRLILASSLDRALGPLGELQRRILTAAVIACLVAVLACHFIARLIARPIQELVTGTRRIAAGQFDRPVAVRRHDELGLLADHFNEMAAGLQERDTLRDQRTKIERDLALARQIQMDILPKTLPRCPGYDMAAYSLPAAHAGGDIYDLVALTLDPGGAEACAPPVVLLLADATGHGVGPALSVTQVRSMIRIGVRLGAGLEHMFGQINRQLCQDLDDGRFVTAFLGLFDPAAHSITYHSAGQAPLIHFHAAKDAFEWLDSSMIPLGIEEDAEHEYVKPMHIAPGDLVVLLTDGFFEFRNDRGEQFGLDRVADFVREHRDRPAKEILNELITAVRSFANGAEQLDDMTGVVIRRLPTA